MKVDFCRSRKTVDESMSAKQFCTNLKGYLLHYFYSFRELKPLGTEMKNLASSRLGTMLHLEIQNGKVAMNTSELQKISLRYYCVFEETRY